MILLQSLLNNPVLSCCLAVTIVSLTAICGGAVLKYRAAMNSSLLFSALLVIMFCPVIVACVFSIGLRFNISGAIPDVPPESFASIVSLSNQMDSDIDSPSESADFRESILLGDTHSHLQDQSVVQTLSLNLNWNVIWQLLAGSWLIGSCIGTIKIFRALAGTVAIAANSRPIENVELEAARQRVGQELALKQLPAVRSSERIDGPVVVGVHAPVILLPLQFANSLSTEELIHVLMHEGAHVKHRDNCVRLIQQITIVIWWWHPCVHLLVSRLCLAREQVCDNTVLNKVDAVSYGETLLKAAVYVSKHKPPTLASALFGSQQTLEFRVQYFLNPRRSKMTHTGPFAFPLFLLLLFGSALIVNASRIQAQNPLVQNEAEETLSKPILDPTPTDTTVLAKSAAAKTIRKVTIEVRGISCVSRFTDSLRKEIVQKIDGVEGCSFAYLPESENEATEFNPDPNSKDFLFGGKGRLTFQVQADFNDRLLIKRLVESKYYNTSSWVWVRRSKLSDFETLGREK